MLVNEENATTDELEADSYMDALEEALGVLRYSVMTDKEYKKQME
jgi:hypothetical protein